MNLLKISFPLLVIAGLVSAAVNMGIVGLVQIIVVLLAKMLQKGKYIFFTKLEGSNFLLVFAMSENVVQLMATVGPVQIIVIPIIVEMETLEIPDALTASKSCPKKNNLIFFSKKSLCCSKAGWCGNSFDYCRSDNCLR